MTIVNLNEQIYIGAIESHVQMAFPTSKVTVWVEDSPLYPHEMMIRARVDNCGASTHIVGRHSSEEHIADILIALIKDVINEKQSDQEKVKNNGNMPL